MRLTREFFVRDVTLVAKSLLGKVICVNHTGEVIKARIVETESYGGVTDKAAHSYQGKRTKRTEIMFSVGGHTYIYLIYGMYHLLNFIAGEEGNPVGVLIRAVEPITNSIDRPTNGPGKLTRALGIDLGFYGIDVVTSDKLYLEDDGYVPSEIVESKRINIDYAQEDKERLWRFYIKNNPFVSKEK